MPYPLRRAGRTDRLPRIPFGRLEPLAAICREFPEEFNAELAARRKFLPGATDAVLPGAITDDGRIRRYMHASHAAIHAGFPARWAGNRFFPNGYFETDLKRAAVLKIYGAVDETRDFTLDCDGKKRAARFSTAGVFETPLAPGDALVTVRISKRGSHYPRIYAIITANA